jgi:hypothetical protein
MALSFLYCVQVQEEIQRKTGYIVMQEDGTFDVDANTSIDHLSQELGIKLPEVLFLVRIIAFSAVAVFDHKFIPSGNLDIGWYLKCNSGRQNTVHI